MLTALYSPAIVAVCTAVFMIPATTAVLVAITITATICERAITTTCVEY